MDAAAAVRARGHTLDYWITVARCAALADAHPEWMATLQGHDEWRHDHERAPAVPAAAPDAVVAAWPWVPVSYAEAFAAHIARVERLVRVLPPAEFVFLAELQGPPSACGCGNLLCRWATDYTLHGRPPQRQAKPLGPDAAARFVAAVQALMPSSKVLPVWVTECEEADTVKDGACHGVSCYHGACWREFDRQWQPLRAQCAQVALLLTHRSLGRNLPRFQAPAGWVHFAIEHLRERELQRHGRPLPDSGLVAVLEGGGADEIAAQIAFASAAGVDSTLVCAVSLPQTFEPRLRRGAPPLHHGGGSR